MNATLSALDFASYSNKFAFLFDIYQPFEVSGVGQERHSKYYPTSFTATSEVFREFPNVSLVAGDVRKTVPATEVGPIAFLHVDLNDAELEVEMIKLLWPRIIPGGIVLLDDYANRGEEKSYEACKELFRSLNRQVLSTPSGQGLVLF